MFRFILTVASLVFVSVWNVSELGAAEFSYPENSYHRVSSNNETIGKSQGRFAREQDRYRFFDDSLLKLRLHNTDQRLNTRMSVLTDSNLRALEFDYTLVSSDSQVHIKGTRQDNRIRIEKVQHGAVQRTEIFVQDPLLFSPLIRPYAVRHLLPLESDSKTVQVNLFEPSAPTVIPMTLELKKTNQKDVYELNIEYLTHKIRSRIRSDGSLLSENTDFFGLPVLAQPINQKEYENLSLQVSSVDLVEQTKVDFPPLPDARTRDSLRVRLSGVSLNQFQLNRHRQELREDVLTITKEKEPFLSAPAQSLVGRAEFQDTLKAEISIPVFAPQIQRKAQKLIEGKPDLLERAKAIHRFVHGHLKKDPYVSLPDAIEALEKGKGDCNEHAILFAALARAAGVPTRIVVGLVYSDSFYAGGTPGFYYHAWVEVFTGVRWLSMDPTWDQIPVDATHIALVEGGADKQIQIASVMSRIQLEKLADPATVN